MNSYFSAPQLGLAAALGLGGAWACGGQAMETCPPGDEDCTLSPGAGGATVDGSGGQQGGSGGEATGGSPGGTGGGAGGDAPGGGGTGGDPVDPVPPGAFACEAGVIPGVTTRLLNRQYDATVRDLLGITSLDAHAGAAPSELLVADSTGPLTELGAAAYQAVAEAIATQVLAGPERSNFISCDAEDVECLVDAIETFGRKAFRRPLTSAEMVELESLIPAPLEGQGDAAATQILTAILTSPHFIQREIVGEGGGDGSSFELTSFELATRLAYFVWGSTPDDALLAAAQAGELSTDEQVRAQVERMLEAPQARTGVLHAHRYYLGIRPGTHWFLVEQDPAIFPYSEEVIPSSAAELDAFFDEIAFSGGTFRELFLSNQGFVNATLAPIYGLDPAAFDSELEPTPLAAEERPGFLTRVGFLSSFSGYNMSNPMVRGIYIETQVLGIALPPPPPSGILPSLPGEFTSNRQRYEVLTSPEPCRFCHEPYINPPGFVMESYDAVGSWQTVDMLGGPIDPVADVYFGDRVETIETSLELMEHLAESGHARRRYADQLVAFAFERVANAQDACIAEELAALLEDDQLPLLDLWPVVATSDAFRIGGPSPIP